MTKIVSCINLKGGVGKTAVAVNLADYCAMEGYKTLLVDLDPQTNATFCAMGVDAWQEHSKSKGTVAHLLGARDHASAEGGKKTVKDVLVSDLLQGVDLIPSHLELFTIDLDLASKINREGRLKKALKEVKDDYDIIICDCPPNLTIPTQNAISASSHYIVPVSPDFLSAIGIALLKTRISSFCEELDHEIELSGIVLSRVGRPARVRSETIGSIREQFGDEVLDGQLTERAVVAECAENTISVFESANNDAKKDFRKICEQILDRIGL